MSFSFPAFWSAVAATSAAVSSFLIYRVQKQNREDSIRPDLEFLEWGRRQEKAGDTERDIVFFKILRNVGQGPAHDVELSGHNVADGLSLASLAAQPVAFLPVGRPVQIVAELEVLWENIEAAADGSKRVKLNIVATCMDQGTVQYVTRHCFQVFDPLSKLGNAIGLAPGVLETGRLHTKNTAFDRKLKRWADSHPSVGRLMRSIMKKPA